MSAVFCVCTAIDLSLVAISRHLPQGSRERGAILLLAFLALGFGWGYELVRRLTSKRRR